MSRCFPFPPPGYENTARSDNVDLPSKEKHKEKKHKKESKDKDKKKDKDRNKDKHKEKKDRKEKHRDKKDKDKNKEKDTTRPSDDTRTGERAESHHEVKLGESSRGPQVGRDSKFTDELGRRTRDEEKGATNSMGENSGGSVQRRAKGIGITPGIENQRFAGTEVVPNSVSRLEKNDYGLDQPGEKFAISAQRIEGIASSTRMEKEKGASDSMDVNLTSIDNKRNHGMRFTMDKPLGLMQERSQGRTVATVQKEPGVTKISKAAGTLLPNSIGTEHRTNHIVATNFTSSDDRRNHGMGSTGDKSIGSMQHRFQGGSSAQKELGGVKISNTIGTKVANSSGTEQRTNYSMGRAVDSTFPVRAEGIRTTVLEKERGKNNNVVAAPVPEKERGRSNNAVAYLFDPIDGRNDGIGDTADGRISSFHSPAEKGRVGGNQLVANLIPPEQRRNDGMLIPPEQRRNDGMGSNTEVKKKRDRDGDTSKGERHRDRDKREKKSKKDKDRHKEKKKEKERRKEKGENKHKGVDKPRDDKKMDLFVSPIIKPLASQKDVQKMDILDSPVIKPLAAHKDDRKIDLLASPVIKPLTSHKDVNMHKEDVKSRDIGKRDMLISHVTKPLASHLDSAKGSLTDGNNNKRKEIKMNGIPHENVARASKIMKTSLPSHLPLENGGKLEPNSIVGPSLSHGAMNTITARVSDNKGPKFNGTKESRPASLDLQSPATTDTNGNVTRSKPLQATLETGGNVTHSKSSQAETRGNVTRPRPPQVNAETSGNVTRSKTPHPDSKYLLQIYSVPKMQEWPEFDEQEWLFSRDGRCPKPKAVTEIEDTQQVWAEAMHIESGDAIALPYVIPF